MKKVLVITYYWPPTGGSGVQRWVKFSKYLPEHGWQPIIYTPENPDRTSVDHSLEKDIPEGTKIIRRPITEFYSIYRKLMGKKDVSAKEVNPINSRQRTLKQKLMLALRGNLFIPDPRATWIRPSVNYLCKYLKDNPVDAIVSTGPPHSMHLIAMKVAEKTGIPWVADFRDPWSKMFYFKHLCLSKWAERRHLSLERQVLDKADAVVAVSPLVQDDFRAMTSTPIDLITNGFDEDDFKIEVSPDGYFNVTHTGLFSADGNPEIIWTALSKKCKEDAAFRERLRIRLVGKSDKEIIDSIEANGLSDNLVNLGYCDHTVAVREQKNATILILPLRKEPEYRATLPGKLFEYLASLRPILGVGQTDGAMAKILNATSSGNVYEWDNKLSVKEFIDRQWETFLRNGHSGGENEAGKSAISQYSRGATASRMASLLDKISR